MIPTINSCQCDTQVDSKTDPDMEGELNDSNDVITPEITRERCLF